MEQGKGDAGVTAVDPSTDWRRGIRFPHGHESVTGRESGRVPGS
jgi:hypothetical protein